MHNKYPEGKEAASSEHKFQFVYDNRVWRVGTSGGSVPNFGASPWLGLSLQSKNSIVSILATLFISNSELLSNGRAEEVGLELEWIHPKYPLARP